MNKREERSAIERQKILAAIAECAAKLGHVPSVIELEQASKIRRRQVRRLFGSYARALRECKLQPSGPGHKLTMEELFRDWAGVVRKLGKLPSIAEYESLGKYSQGPLTRRFASWLHVPKAMKKFAEQQDWAGEWKEVLEMVDESDGAARRGVKKSGPWNVTQAGRPKPTNVYGPPIQTKAMSHGPTNEAGVMVLFGMLAEELGFAVTLVQTGYPDCEAMRQREEDRFERLRIEFEYESRNFVQHEHDASECDMIVCWKHNWPECPLEVVELRKAVAEIVRA
ncbi:MAG TPA: hypothetical protein VKH81_23780 [Candidatus Angelobacter sp.]|nr:hypothetical protein [Candidatus Angelobacter sp.]